MADFFAEMDASGPRRLGIGISSEKNLCPQAAQAHRYELAFMRVSIGIIIHQRRIYCKQCMAVGEFLQAVPYLVYGLPFLHVTGFPQYTQTRPSDTAAWNPLGFPPHFSPMVENSFSFTTRRVSAQ